MQPQAAVTEFIYAHDYSEKSRVWYDRMLAIFATYCEAEGVSDISEVSAPLVRKFLDTVRLKVNPRSKNPWAPIPSMPMRVRCGRCSTGASEKTS